MLMAWRDGAAKGLQEVKLGDQLDVERSTFSKIRDRSAMRNRLARGTAVADLRCHRRCGVQLILEGSRSTRARTLYQTKSKTLGHAGNGRLENEIMLEHP